MAYSTIRINSVKHYLRQKIRHLINTRVIYFVSFPKVGRTWAELMFSKAISEIGGYSLEDIVNKKVKVSKNKLTGEKIPKIIFGHGYKNSKICLGNYFPENYYKKKEILFLVRDPRDILISHFYHDKFNYKNFKGELKDFVYFDNLKAYNPRSERYGIKAIVNYLNSFIKNRKIFASFHPVYYEDLKSDVRSVMKDIFLFADLPVDDQFLQKIIDYGHIDNMRKLEQTNELNWFALQSSGKASKVRKGKSGGYMDELDEDDINFLNLYIKEHLDPFYQRYIY